MVRPKLPCRGRLEQQKRRGAFGGRLKFVDNYDEKRREQVVELMNMMKRGAWEQVMELMNMMKRGAWEQVMELMNMMKRGGSK